LSLPRLVADRLEVSAPRPVVRLPGSVLPTLTSGVVSFHLGVAMIEVTLEESDRLDWALKTFKKKVLKAGILKDLRRKRHYVKPSEARQLKMAAARRRGRPSRPSR
jgi:small subunit ribosomal protein S21